MAGKFLYCMLCKSPPKYWIRSLCHSVIVYLLTTLETPDVNEEFYKIKGILWPWEFIGSFCFSSPEVIILFVAMNVGCFTKKLSIRHLLFEKKQFLEHYSVSKKSAYSLYPRNSKNSWPSHLSFRRGDETCIAGLGCSVSCA